MTPADLLDQLAVPLAFFDEAGRLLHCNAAWTALAAALPDDATHGALVRPAAAPDRVFRLDLQATKDGRAAMLVEVTEEVAAIERLEFKNRVRTQLLCDAQVGTWSFDPDLELYTISDELTGDDERAQGQVPLAALRSMQHPDDVAGEDEIRGRLTSEGGVAVNELRYRMQDETWLHLLVHYRTGRKTTRGLYEMYGLSQNVTAVAQARDDARAAAARLRLALAAAKAGVYEYDYDSDTISISPELKEMLSPEALDEALTRPMAIFASQDVERLRTALRAQDDAKIPPLEVRLRHAQGERWISLYHEIEYDAEGRRKRGVGLVLDIEERKQQALALEEAHRAAEAATQAKSQFLATVSHEIRTPMNGVVGVLSLLQREQLSAQGQRLAQEAVACGEMLSRLLNDILDFSKIEAGKLELAPAPTDVGHAIHGVTNLLKPQAVEKGLYLRIELPEQVGPVMVDPLRLRQCLFNLVGNALKFTETGGVVVRLRPTGEPGRPMFRIEVEDTGVGIPEAARPRLFSLFSQAEAATAQKFGGTGLGLAVSRQLAQLMGGDAGFSSRPEGGSIFWFDFDAPPTAAADAIAVDTFSGAPLAGLKILIVDDNPTNQLIGRVTIEAMGGEAVAAPDGLTGIEALGHEAYDLILMDVNMPGIDGLETTRRIRVLPDAAAQTPIVALTADGSMRQRRACLAAGMNDVAAKPVLPAQLLSAILPLVGRSANAGPSPALAKRRNRQKV